MSSPVELAIFVPTIMGAGLVVSLATLLRDAIRGLAPQSARREVLVAHATAHGVLTGDERDGLRPALRPRPYYLVVGATMVGVGLYVAIGALGNYARPGNPFADAAWMLAVSLTVATLLAGVGAAALGMFVTWPRAPGWASPALTATPLTRRPTAGTEFGGPSWFVTYAWTVTTALLAALTVAVAASVDGITQLDDGVARVVHSWEFADAVATVDPIWHIEVAMGLALVVGIATIKCRPFAMTYIASVVLAGGADAVLKALVERERPPGAPSFLTGDSYPSGHLVQATLMAWFLPLAVFVLTRRRNWARAIGFVFTVGIAGTSVQRIRNETHWTSDVLGGLLLGLVIALGGRWMLSHQRYHPRCRACPWRGEPAANSHHAKVGVVHVDEQLLRHFRAGSRIAALAVVAGFSALVLTVGVPVDPEGDLMSSEVAEPVQLGLLVIAAVGAIAAWRWLALGAVLMAVSGLVLGLFAAMQYRPVVSVAVVAAFLVPAAGMWLAWQHTRTWRAIVTLAVTTGLLATGAWAGSIQVHDRFFGPAHPASVLRPLRLDLVEWVWSGAVTAREATVVARVATGDTSRLLARAVGSSQYVASPTVDVGRDRLARLSLSGLAPSTTYEYVVEVDGERDESRGAGRLRTFPAMAASFTVAAASCARTGSNGAVYDAIRAAKPDLYVITGDLHYGNLSTDSPADFVTVAGRALSAAAQAALYREAPVAYVWDDHDYGPNDAAAESPSRDAARAAYRSFVPHYPLADDGAIYQAFTLGRARFLITDTRSERTSSTMLGARQLTWLEDELVRASRTHALVVWVNPDPWIGVARVGGDGWNGHAAERTRIADVIARNGVDNLVMVSGDAHMVAIDDGTNSGYATGGGGGFPVLHAAALDRPGSVKGGPYSEGAYPGAGQFGTLDVLDDGKRMAVELAGWDWTGRRLVSYSFTPGPGAR